MNVRRTRLSRPLSVLLASTMTALLVFSGGVANAEDGVPDPPPAETVTEAPTPAEEPPTPADEPPPPAEEPPPPAEDNQDPAPDTEEPTAPTDDAAPSEDVEDVDAQSPGGGEPTGPNTFANILSSPAMAVTAMAALAVPCVGGPGAPVGGFEIDGNICAQAPVNKDWDNTGASVEDGFDDATGFSGGSSENDPPTSWTVGGSPNGKTDIGTAWAYSQVSGGQVYGFFGLTNNSTSGGTSQYDLEYNQLNPVSNGGGFAVPNRSPGDLLFRFSSTGSAAIVFTDAKKYTLVSSPAWSNGSCFSTTANNTAGWCTIAIPPASFAQQVNADGTFFEGAINISLFFGNGTCSGTFGTTSIRSVTGNAFATSALKDYVTPLGVNTPSTCGKIVINKQDLAGNPLGGATFSVSPNPDPALPNGTAYSITDNDSKDKDPANGVIEISPVDPNESYTVTETSPPAGYLLPAQPSQGPTLVGPSQTITFTFNDPKQFQALTATKSANPTYTAQYAWSIIKEVSPNGQDGWVDDAITKNLPANGNPTLASLFYRVKVTEGARIASNYKVSGNVSVTNPNATAVTADISDSLPGATCLVAGNATHTVAVPGNSTVPYAYVCSFAGVPTLAELTGTNTASVSWDKSDYPQVQGDINAVGSYSISPTAGYAFGAETTSIDKTVTVTDSHHVFNPALTYSWSNEGSVHTSDVYTIAFSAVPGSCSDTVVNTATLTGATSGILDVDTASGTICAAQDLTITRIDARGFKRTYPWAIEKKTTTPKVVISGGTATADYEVTVTAGEGADSEWAMSGTITAHNPNTFEPVSVTSVPVTYTGGGTCAVTGEVFPVAIPASGSHAFAYSCTFGVQPSYTGTVNATINWDQAAASTPNGSVSDGVGVTEASWVKTLVNATVTVHDDHAAGEDNVVATLNWADVRALPNHQQVLTYTVDLQDLPDGGTCGTKVNTAWVLGDGQTQLDSDQNAGNNSATVQVCNPLGLSIGDSAVGDFTRTYDWQIDKFIDTDKKSQQVTIDSYDHTFSYRVIATPLDRVDSAWTVTGSITVENDNTDAAIDPITVTGVTELLAGVNESCLYDKAVPFDLASNENATVNFTCTTATPPTNNGAEPPVYAGTHSANVTWGVAGTATSTPAALTWNAPTEVDKSIAVYDNKVTNIFIPVQLGDADWNATGTPVVFTYDLNLTVPKETAGGCAPPFDNLAWLGGNGIIPTQRQSAAQAIICVNAAAWTLEKSSVSDPDPLLPGGTITYTLTVKHTAGVPAENVVVEDDLSQVLNNASGLTSVKIDGVDAVLQPVADILTWTIPVLTDTATLEYTVTVDDDAWATTFTNAATPESPGGTCVGENQCTTTDTTPTLPKLTLVKEVINGKGGVAEPVDWTVTATPSNIDGQDAVSGNGDPTDPGGVSAVDVLPGVYNLDESGGPAGYSQVGDWDCGDAQQESDQVALGYGDTVTCAVTNQQDSVWEIVKSSDPESGTVEPGQEITYTLTPTWVAGVNPTDLDITDDYSGLVGKTSPVEIVNPDVTFNGDDTFTWHINTLTDETVPLSYTVTVNEDAIGVTLINLVTAPGTNCEPLGLPRSLAIVLPVTPDDCTVVHVTPEWTLEKTSDPESGSTVDPGQVITYTLTATNVSDALVTGQQVTDDLSDVLDTATLNETPDDVLWSVVGTTLTWNVPDLEPGESAQLVYSVTLDAEAINVVLNVATPEPPTGHCVTEDGCATGHVPSPLPPVVDPPAVDPPHPAGLPDTGGPDRLLLLVALGLLGAGGVLVLGARGRGRRS